jgi:hypothetical protein
MSILILNSLFGTSDSDDCHSATDLTNDPGALTNWQRHPLASTGFKTVLLSLKNILN